MIATKKKKIECFNETAWLLAFSEVAPCPPEVTAGPVLLVVGCEDEVPAPVVAC
jgi:hypothetical protein